MTSGTATTTADRRELEQGFPSPQALERMRIEADRLERFARREAEHFARLEADPTPWTGLERLD